MTAVMEPGVRDDTAVWPVMTQIAACLCDQVAGAGLGELCFCGVLPGQTAATDYVSADAGMAWVRLVSAYPSLAFPAQMAEPGCVEPLAFVLEVGTAFCAPVGDSRGNPPDIATMLDTTRVQVAAMAAGRRAISCCPGVRGKDMVLGTYTPFGPQGAVVGGAWTVTVAQGAARG